MPPRKGSGRKKPAKKPVQKEEVSDEEEVETPQVAPEQKAAAAEHKKRGNAAFIANKFDEAVNHFTMAILEDPHDNVFYSNRSACFASLGQWERAAEDGATCVRIKPAWPKGYTRLGLAKAEMKDYPAAIKAYTTCLEIESNPTVADALEECKAAHKAKVMADVASAKQGDKLASDLEGASIDDAETPERGAETPAPPTDYVIGIDLGTTFSCVAVWRNGQAEVLASAEGDFTVPSWVAFLEDGSRVVGDPAKRQAANNTKNTLFNIKRIIGREFGDCSEELKVMPFKVTNSDGKPLITVKVDGKLQTFAPEQISAMVLEKMKAIAEHALGVPITKAVVTVPAYFNDAQRRLTKDAGTIAGLNVLRIINEPTAAALAYGLDQKTHESKQTSQILVFDLGGGTFDVSMLRLQDGVFEVLATAGDTHLGGEDFDSKVADWVAAEHKKSSGKELFKDDAKAKRKLRNACEAAKRQLANASTATIEVFLGEEEIMMPLTRAQFDKLNESTFQRCLDAVKRCLNDAKLSKDDVDDIVLVGGSTRVVRVQEILSEFFGGKALCKSVHPDQAVAYGAAVQGAILAGVRDPATQALLLVDVIPLSLGVECEGRQFAKVVNRNTSLPCRKSSEFTTVEDWQTSVDIRIFEGERSVTDGNHLLGEFTITGVQRARRGEPKVDVTFEVNTNGLLTVSACDKITNASADVEIQHDKGRLSPEEIEKMCENAARLRAADEARIAEMERQEGMRAPESEE